MGRHITPRIKVLGVRVTAGEFLSIVAAAGDAGMQPVAWVRHLVHCALDGKTEIPDRFYAPPPETPPAKLTRSAGTRFSEEQFEKIDFHSRACGLPISAFIRQVVLGATPRARRPELRSAIVAVNRVGNNLNQLVRLANSGVVLSPELVGAVHDVLVELRALQKSQLRADAGDD